MNIKMMLAAVVISGATALASAQDVSFGGPAKDILKTAQEGQAPVSVPGVDPVVAGLQKQETALQAQSKATTDPAKLRQLALEHGVVDAMLAARLKNASVKSSLTTAVSVLEVAKDPSARVVSAGKGLLSDEFPIDPMIAKLPAYAEKISFKQTGMEKADHSWRRNDWGVCRAWLTCDSGRQISCWAQGWNCDSYANFGNNANVFCTAWGGNAPASSSWDTCP